MATTRCGSRYNPNLEPRLPKREITARLARRGENEEEFDRRFWSTFTGEERVELLWDMVLEVRRLKGGQGDEPRLQRSVLRVERLRRDC